MVSWIKQHMQKAKRTDSSFPISGHQAIPIEAKKKVKDKQKVGEQWQFEQTSLTIVHAGRFVQAKGPMLLHLNRKNGDQTDRMHRLITGCTDYFVRLTVPQLIFKVSLELRCNMNDEVYDNVAAWAINEDLGYQQHWKQKLIVVCL